MTTTAPAPYFADERITVHHGDALDVLATLADESVHSVIVDPPYALRDLPVELIVDTYTRWLAGERDFTPGGRGFMGHEWDEFVPPPAAWDQCMRILKPGGWLLSFAGSRTQDLMGTAIRMAGFEVRDGIAWLYGSGFPKSHDVSKAIDKAAGAERAVVGTIRTNVGMQGGNFTNGSTTGDVDVTRPATPEAETWDGWGTALKPGFEPIIVARKPFPGTVASNVLQHSTGALNIRAARIPHRNAADLAESTAKNQHATFGTEPGGNKVYGDYSKTEVKDYDGSAGRWPTNVALDESQADELDRQTGVTQSRIGKPRAGRAGDGWGTTHTGTEYDDAGGASRFFPTFRYEAKAPGTERPEQGGVRHSTVKPLDFIRWLVRLTTPPGGTVVDFCAGSGTTGEAALIEGFHSILVEREAKHMPLIMQRVRRPHQQALFGDLE